MSQGEVQRAAAISPAAARRRFGAADSVYRAILAGTAITVLLVVGLIVFETAKGAGLSIRAFGLGFLTGTEWDPVTEKFGALPYIFGTLVSSAIALLLSVPLGVGTAVYLAEIAPRGLGASISFVVELLAAIPSIVYGIWGFFVLAPWLRSGLEPWLIGHFGFLPFFRGYPFGIGMLNAGIVLAIMVVPTIVSISREILLSTPKTLREAAIGLGATPAESIGVVLEAARPGILGAVILALGRALGETMAVTMVIGNTNQISASVLAPAATMASVIANEFSEATTPLYLSALVEIALVLFAVTILVNGCARLLVRWTLGERRTGVAA